MKTTELVEFIEQELGGVKVVIQESKLQDTLLIDKEDLLTVCGLLYNSEKIYADFLSSVTAVDNGPEVGTLDVIYHLVSLTLEFEFILKVTLPRMVNDELPSLDSVTGIWASANWHEREAYDLVGVKFNNHPDLRRILLPKNWEGHPLRKDYKEQEYYHGIKVKY